METLEDIENQGSGDLEGPWTNEGVILRVNYDNGFRCDANENIINKPFNLTLEFWKITPYEDYGLLVTCGIVSLWNGVLAEYIHDYALHEWEWIVKSGGFEKSALSRKFISHKGEF